MVLILQFLQEDQVVEEQDKHQERVQLQEQLILEAEVVEVLIVEAVKQEVQE